MTTIVFALCFLIQAFQSPGPQKNPVKKPDYVLGPGDVISIHVLGVQEFDQVIRVSNSGKIHVPYLGLLKVHGLTLHQVEAEIATNLVERHLVKEPWVQVQVTEYRAHPVYILGEVQNPGQYMLTGEMRVLDLITMAGAFNDVFSPTGYLYRRKESQDLSSDNTDPYGEDEVIKIEFSALYDEKHSEMNMLLRGGDILYVPERRNNYFFIVGDVGKPGAFAISSDDQVLATQAIAKAGGPLKTAKMRKGILVRYTKDGEREEKLVDFQAILRGKKPDLPILPNDIIFIPGSSAKTVGYGLLGVIPGIITQGLVF